MASDSSDDDRPLARTNGRKSNSTPKMVSTSSAPLAGPAISIRNGPVEDRMDVDSGVNGKRKSRSSIDNRVSYKEDQSDSDAAPLAKRRKSKHQDTDSDDEPIAVKRTKKLPPSIKETALLESDEDDVPIVSHLIKKKAAIEKTAAKTAAELRAKETNGKKRVNKVESSDDDEPLAAKPRKRQSNGAATAKKTNGVKAESDSDAPLSKKKATPKTSAKPTPKAKAAATPVKKEKAGAKKPKLEEDEDEEKEGEEEFEWWNAPKKEDDSVKWETLEHNGVAFPPPYEPLPKNVRLLYDGKPVELAVDAEEVATFFGSMLHSTQNVENPVFQKNFFSDFQDVLKQTGGAKDKQGNKVPIKEFEKLDFTKIFAHFQALNEAKKARTKDEKKADKDAKTKEEEPFMFCKWDGRKQKVGNFRVEPPGLFRGRGQHPKTGRVKKRVLPEQITINIGKGAKVPAPPPGHKWKAVQHDNKATWLAMWQENINNAYKYVMLAANSDVKGQSDYKKFEKARELKKHIDRIRADYTKDLKSDVMADRQRATAMYLIDKLALRAGNEKDTDNEADTVGCCSLKYEHITLKEEGNTVIFDFLGKDSIRYYDEVSVDRQVFKNLKMFKKAPKEAGDDVFDRLNTSQLNKHLSSYMPGLTAKVFRTYNASFTMSQLLMELDDKKGKQNLTTAEKVKLYNDCNRKVAILCNHKRTVGAAHDTQMEKLGDRIKGLKYQKWRTKMMMIDVEPKMKKKKGADYFEKDEDLTDEWVAEHQAFLVEDMRTKITKKFEKDNEKRAAEGEKPHPEKELKERLKAASELKAKLDKENKTKKVLAEGKAPSVEKLEAAVQKIEERIHSMELQAADKDDNKEVALGTSKINYIDPRLTVVFVNKVKVPIEKFFSKTLRDKFNWAIKSIGDDDSWEF